MRHGWIAIILLSLVGFTYGADQEGRENGESADDTSTIEEIAALRKDLQNRAVDEVAAREKLEAAIVRFKAGEIAAEELQKAGSEYNEFAEVLGVLTLAQKLNDEEFARLLEAEKKQPIRAVGRKRSTNMGAVAVELRVVEVHLDKLRSLGFDWESFRTRNQAEGAGREVFGLLSALDQYDCARAIVVVQTTLSSGQVSAIDVKDLGVFKFDLQSISSEHASVEYHATLTIGDSDTAATAVNSKQTNRTPQITTTNVAELQLGESAHVWGTKIRRRDQKGKLTERAVLILLTADSAEINTASE